MPDPAKSEPARWEDNRILLGLLNSVEEGACTSQRRLASELGIALGLVNAYLKRCVKKGLVKVSEAPARRYAYYLTPKGFAEKSRLTVEFLSYSFSFFRQAKADYAKALRTAKARGIRRIVLAGKSDLAEIAAICALEQGVEILAIVDSAAEPGPFVGVPVVDAFESVGSRFDAVLVTDAGSAAATIAFLYRRFPLDQVVIPDLLNVWADQDAGAQQ